MVSRKKIRIFSKLNRFQNKDQDQVSFRFFHLKNLLVFFHDSFELLFPSDLETDNTDWVTVHIKRYIL